MSPRRPNILILMPDELRADALGYAGHPVYRTPHVDRLAREGVAFANAYCTSPLCMPARASMISGLYPHNHHIQENAGSLPLDDESYAHLIRQAGYATAYIGKSHFGADTPRRDLVDDEAAVRARGFDDVHQVPGPLALARTDSHLSRRWQALGLLEAYREDYRRRAQDGGAAAWASPLPVEEFADSYVGARAEAWLRAYRQERPFLLVVGFGGPHPPFDPPEPYASMYDPRTIPDPIPAGEPGDWVPEYVRRRMLELTGAQDRGHAPHVAQEIARQRMASYGGKISLIDDRMGRILAVLDERGWTEDTLVIFLADHGEMGGDHGRYNKSVFFESAARIPLVMRWPAALPPGGRVEALVEQLDLFATVVEAAGAPPSRRAFARSLLPLARGDAGAGQRGPRPSRASWGPPLGSSPRSGRPEMGYRTASDWGRGALRDAVFAELKREIMVRTAGHKYTVDAQGRGFQLYDMRQDPREQRNLVGHPDYREAERELRERLLTWLVSTQVIRGSEARPGA